MRLVLAMVLVTAFAFSCVSGDKDDLPTPPSSDYLEAIAQYFLDDPRRDNDRETSCSDTLADMQASAAMWRDIEPPPELAKAHEAVGEALALAASRFADAGDACLTDADSLEAAAAYHRAYQEWCSVLIAEFDVDESSCDVRIST